MHHLSSILAPMTFNRAVDMVGNTPCVRIDSAGMLRSSLFLKLEGLNPTGSIKDRACFHILDTARDGAQLRVGTTLLDASSGNFACSLAFFGQLLGYPVAVAVTSKLTSEKLSFLRYLNATIYQIGDFTIQGSIFCRELAEKEPDRYYFLDQLHNWQNPEAHYRSTGPELLSTFPTLSMVVGTLGSGGSMSGTARYLKEHAPHVQIVVVDCASGSRLPGTGTFVDGDYVTPFIFESYQRGYFDLTFHVTEADAFRQALMLRSQGILAGPQTGAVIHAAKECARTLESHDTVVAISGDHSWKNLDRLVSHIASR